MTDGSPPDKVYPFAVCFRNEGAQLDPRKIIIKAAGNGDALRNLQEELGDDIEGLVLYFETQIGGRQTYVLTSSRLWLDFVVPQNGQLIHMALRSGQEPRTVEERVFEFWRVWWPRITVSEKESGTQVALWVLLLAITKFISECCGWEKPKSWEITTSTFTIILACFKAWTIWFPLPNIFPFFKSIWAEPAPGTLMDEKVAKLQSSMREEIEAQTAPDVGHLQTILDELRTEQGTLVAGHTLVKEDISKLADDADKNAHDIEELDKTVNSLRENVNEHTTSKDELQESLRTLTEELEVTKTSLQAKLQMLKDEQASKNDETKASLEAKLQMLKDGQASKDEETKANLEALWICLRKQ